MWTPAYNGSGSVSPGSRTPARITIDLVTPPSSLTPVYNGSGSGSPLYSLTPVYNGSGSGSPGSVIDLTTGVDAGVLCDKLLALVQPLDISKLPSWGSVVQQNYSSLPRDVWRLFLVWLMGHESNIFTVRRLCRDCRRHVDEYLPFWRSFGVPESPGFSLSTSVIRHYANVERRRLLKDRKRHTASSTSIKQKISRREKKILDLQREKRQLEVELAAYQELKEDITTRVSEITSFKFKRAKRIVKKTE
jgi:hypothetical protein